MFVGGKHFCGFHFL